MPTKPSDAGWNTVAEGAATRVNFDTIGDVYIGTYLGTDHITPPDSDAFDVYQFTTAGDQTGLSDGELVAINQSYDLRNTFEKIAPGTLCRIEYVKDVPTGRGLNPMKSFKVQTKA